MLLPKTSLSRCYHRAAAAAAAAAPRSRTRPKPKPNSRKPSRSSTPAPSAPGLSLKLDPRKDGNFEDFKIRRDLATRLSANLNISTPTSTEKKILSVLRSDYSLLARNAPGTGKSTALLVHGLNVRTLRTGEYDPLAALPRPNVLRGLLLLSSSFSVIQCQQLYDKLYPSAEEKLRAPAHFLYRSASPDVEFQQLANPTLRSHCHLLVATAPRLLDVISADVACLPQLDRLAFIGVDDADEQLLSDPNAKGQLSLSDADAKRKPTPSETLIDFLVSLAEDPSGIQFAFANSSSVSANLRQLIEFKNWAATKGENAVGFKKLVAVGNPEIDMSKVLPYRRIPRDVQVHALTVKPVPLTEQQQQQQQTFEFKNVKIPDVPTGLDALSELSSPETKSFDAAYRSYRLSLLQKRSNRMKNQRQSKDAEVPVSYIFPALGQFLQTGGVGTDVTGRAQTPSLVVIPDTASLKGTLASLREFGINAKMLAPATGDGRSANDDYSTYEDYVSQQQEQQANAAPAVLLTSLHSIKGTPFPNLSTLICLGIDTVKDAHTLVTLATRLRSHSGLIESHSDSNTGNAGDSSGATADKPEKKVVLLAPKNDFGSREALALYRVLVECGLKGLDAVDGVQMESLADYELPSDVDADALEG